MNSDGIDAAEITTDQGATLGAAVEGEVEVEGEVGEAEVAAGDRAPGDMGNRIRGGAGAGVSRSPHWHCLAATV